MAASPSSASATPADAMGRRVFESGFWAARRSVGADSQQRRRALRTDSPNAELGLLWKFFFSYVAFFFSFFPFFGVGEWGGVFANLCCLHVHMKLVYLNDKFCHAIQKKKRVDTDMSAEQFSLGMNLTWHV
jgi:hypothetical protein